MLHYLYFYVKFSLFIHFLQQKLSRRKNYMNIKYMTRGAIEYLYMYTKVLKKMDKNHAY